MRATTRPWRVLALAGALGATLATAACGGYDRDAYCAAVREVSAPTDLTGPGTGEDAAVRAYLEQVRTLEGLAPRGDEGRWRTLREGLESVMTDGRVDVDKVEQAQRELTLMAQAAEELDTSLVPECGVGLSGG
jgi:hypothetical protein